MNRSTPSQVIGRLLDAVGQFEGSDGIESIVATGYKGELSQELLSLYDGDENGARRAIQRLAATQTGDWEDVDDEWSDAIKAAHPTRSGSHEDYGIAMKMVGHRHSKGELVALVNWLLVRGGALDSVCETCQERCRCKRT